MYDVHDVLKNLEYSLGEELMKTYFSHLRKWILFNSSSTKEEFDINVRQLFTNEEQIKWHNQLVVAILFKNLQKVKQMQGTKEGTVEGAEYVQKPKPARRKDEGVFECPEYVDFIKSTSPESMLPVELEHRSAAAELFMPDSGFVACRIGIVIRKNRMDGADDSVTDMVIQACQVFVKNILTAMISRKKGYKIRDNKFQYGFNQPIPDPFIRNYNNVVDETQESKVEVSKDDDIFLPKCKTSLENAEQQVAFAYSCAKRWKSDNVLTVKLLYDTLRENSYILGMQGIQSVNMLKLGLQLED